MNPDLDPQVVNLAKAIRQVESGGDFSAKGKAGELGAYQFTPDTWNANAPNYGINTSLDKATPEQQNAVAYNRIKAWKDSGKDVTQIASMWNAGVGEPNAYTGAFSNGAPSASSKFNVPQYVESVANTYQQLKGASPQGTAQPAQVQANQPSLMDQWLSPDLMVKDVQKYGATAAPAALGMVGLSELPAVFGGGGLVSKLFGLGKTAAVGYGIEKGAEALAGATGIGGGNTQQNAPSGTPEQPNQPSGQFDLGLNQASTASNNLRNTYLQALQSTRDNRILAGSPKGQAIINTASVLGVAPDIDENGNMDFTEASKKLDSRMKETVSYEKALAGEGDASPMSASNLAERHAMENDAEFGHLNPQERREAGRLATEEIRSYGPLNQPMSIPKMIEARHQQYERTRGKYGGGLTTVQIAAHKAAAHGLREAVRQSTKNPALYDAFLKHEKNLIGIRDLIKRLDKKKAPANNSLIKSFLRGSARYAEIFIGDKLGGAFGAILGAMVGEHLNRSIDKRFGKTIFETKEMRAALDVLKDSEPQVYRKFVGALAKHDIHVPEHEKGEHKTPAEHLQDIKKDLKIMKSKEGFIKRKNPTALVRTPRTNQ